MGSLRLSRAAPSLLPVPSAFSHLPGCRNPVARLGTCGHVGTPIIQDNPISRSSLVTPASPLCPLGYGASGHRGSHGGSFRAGAASPHTSPHTVQWEPHGAGAGGQVPGGRVTGSALAPGALQQVCAVSGLGRAGEGSGGRGGGGRGGDTAGEEGGAGDCADAMGTVRTAPSAPLTRSCLLFPAFGGLLPRIHALPAWGLGGGLADDSPSSLGGEQPFQSAGWGGS